MIHGAFRSPEDLCEIYGKIDVNFIVYDANDDNVKIALPNKLYESIAFGKPIICAKGVALAEIVESKRIGVACEIDEIEYSLDLIMDNYREYIDKIFLLSKDEYLDNSESELVKFVENKLGT
jgi:glycosyltransferase involved in cell wall biosynthesis